MSKVIDLGLDLPPTLSDVVVKLKRYFMDPEGQGTGNYRRIFGPRIANSLGLEVEDIMRSRTAMPDSEFLAYLKSIASKMVVEPSEYVQALDQAGVEWGLVFDDDNDRVAEVVSQWPGRFKGIASVDPFKGEESVTELHRVVTELGAVAYYASPFDWGIRADNPRFYPLYSKAVELDIPVFIYSTMNYRTDRPMDIGRPLYLDKVAMDFPSMKIVAECGGWPWVPEMIGVALRHSNVYINTCSHRPKYFGVSGSGWEMLMQFGNSVLQDKILFASGASDMGLPVADVIAEFMELPLKDTVKEKWLYANACHLFKLTR